MLQPAPANRYHPAALNGRDRSNRQPNIEAAAGSTPVASASNVPTATMWLTRSPTSSTTHCGYTAVDPSTGNGYR